jgi:hypothetical protein
LNAQLPFCPLLSSSWFILPCRWTPVILIVLLIVLPDCLLLVAADYPDSLGIL